MSPLGLAAPVLERLGNRARAALRALATEQAAFLLFLVGLILLPHTLAPPTEKGAFGLARVHSGDEPHYMVQLSSVARDHDLDVSNNYAWALAGADDAGELFRGKPLDRHLAAGLKGRTVVWTEFYTTEGWQQGPDGWPPPPKYTDKKAPRFRYSTHPTGLALLLAPVWLTFGSSSLLEPAVIFCSGLALVGILLTLRSLFRVFTTDEVVVRVALVATVLGTPLWHYGRALFTEIYLAAAAVVIYWLAVGARRRWLLGIPVAFGMLMKSFFVVLVAPAFLLLLLKRDFKGLLLACLPVAIASAYVLIMNSLHFGSPFLFSQPREYFKWNPEAPMGLLFHEEHGLFLFAPIVAIAFFGWWHLLRERPLEAGLMLFGALAYSAIFTCVGFWGGGYCYGPRYLVPVIPILMLGLTKIRSTIFGRHPWAMAFSALVLFLSIQINALGALPYWRFWSAHPLKGLF